ncbi:hypothetical protein [Mesorhizobium sp. WSM4906]|uniref:hypothetical protein n=1 Tax=Mesorhizobium sp. WSM4906 TaxID=3038546 RepID=UPI002415B625|nr:hypothetical protein [Mesorhizobium sp. WSM4906]WFP74603.1 hypothetical protein QAZ22_23065 [Mesorhizobium sp. WSM4906]
MLVIVFLPFQIVLMSGQTRCAREDRNASFNLRFVPVAVELRFQRLGARSRP